MTRAVAGFLREGSITMKRLMLVLSILLSVASLVAAQDHQQKSAGSAEQAVLKAEQAWEEALLKSDTAALEKIYAESLIYTHSSGSVDDKKIYIANLKSGTSKYESMKREEIKVSVYGNTAL